MTVSICGGVLEELLLGVHEYALGPLLDHSRPVRQGRRNEALIQDSPPELVRFQSAPYGASSDHSGEEFPNVALGKALWVPPYSTQRMSVDAFGVFP